MKSFCLALSFTDSLTHSCLCSTKPVESLSAPLFGIRCLYCQSSLSSVVFVVSCLCYQLSLSSVFFIVSCLCHTVYCRSCSCQSSQIIWCLWQCWNFPTRGGALGHRELFATISLLQHHRQLHLLFSAFARQITSKTYLTNLACDGVPSSPSQQKESLLLM